MGNMSYCRFQNTLECLEDCQEYMGDTSGLDSSERLARIELIQLCRDIAGDYGREADEEAESDEP